jgi:hypothetical protein
MNAASLQGNLVPPPYTPPSFYFVQHGMTIPPPTVVQPPRPTLFTDDPAAADTIQRSLQDPESAILFIEHVADVTRRQVADVIAAGRRGHVPQVHLKDIVAQFRGHVLRANDLMLGDHVPMPTVNHFHRTLVNVIEPWQSMIFSELTIRSANGWVAFRAREQLSIGVGIYPPDMLFEGDVGWENCLVEIPVYESIRGFLRQPDQIAWVDITWNVLHRTRLKTQAIVATIHPQNHSSDRQMSALEENLMRQGMKWYGWEAWTYSISWNIGDGRPEDARQGQRAALALYGDEACAMLNLSELSNAHSFAIHGTTAFELTESSGMALRRRLFNV